MATAYCKADLNYGIHGVRHIGCLQYSLMSTFLMMLPGLRV